MAQLEEKRALLQCPTVWSCSGVFLQAKKRNMTKGTVFYQTRKGDLRITRTILEIKGTQYQIRNIDTLRQTKQEPDRSLSEFLTLMGFILTILDIFLKSVDMLVIGISLSLLGLFWGQALKPNYTLIISTTGGVEVKYDSENVEEIKSIKSALAEAMELLE